MNRRLLIFGLRGTLIDRQQASMRVTGPLPAATCGPYHVWQRPHAIDVLQRLSRTNDLAVWSSATHRNTAPFVKAVFSDVPFQFVWSREHCAPDDVRRSRIVAEDDSWAVVKPAAAVSRFTRNRQQQIVWIEDNASKVRRQSHEVIVLPSFDVRTEQAFDDDALRKLEAALHEVPVDAESELPLFL